MPQDTYIAVRFDWQSRELCMLSAVGPRPVHGDSSLASRTIGGRGWWCPKDCVKGGGDRGRGGGSKRELLHEGR